MSRCLSRRAVALAIAIIAGGATLPTHAKDADEARRIVDEARIAFADVIADKDHQALREGLKAAKAVLIFPSILKGGFVVGGSGGTGVLLVRGENNAWGEPAF
jgi:lipid-binding SYLF domain-containing protein